MTKILILPALMLGVLLGLGTQSALANSRINPPPVVLSPTLTDPWVNQLQPGYKHRPKRSKKAKRTRRGWFFSRQRGQRSAHGTHRAHAARQPVATAPQQRQIAPQFLPTVVDYPTQHAPGTIVIDTAQRYLFLVERDGRARRYGVGVGKLGFSWSGTERITRKAEWPDWRPPAAMIARERAKGRHLPNFMPGGPANPLGARALYLGSTLYRIHGSNQPWTIGHAVSSGCIRMRNQDVTDLYTRVGVGTKVVVL